MNLSYLHPKNKINNFDAILTSLKTDYKYLKAILQKSTYFKFVSVLARESAFRWCKRMCGMNDINNHLGDQSQ